MKRIDEGETFRATLRFCKDLSHFERRRIESHLNELRKVMPEMLTHYLVLRDLYCWKEKDKLDNFHKRLFRYYFKYFELWWRKSPWWKLHIKNLFNELNEMGFSACLEEDREDFRNFILREPLRFHPLIEVGFSVDEIEEISKDVYQTVKIKLGVDGFMAMLERRGTFKTLLEGVENINKLWRSYTRELIEEDFLGEKFKVQNPGSRETFKRILIITASIFLQYTIYLMLT
jgi:hypothetical protein